MEPHGFLKIPGRAMMPARPLYPTACRASGMVPGSLKVCRDSSPTFRKFSNADLMASCGWVRLLNDVLRRRMTGRVCSWSLSMLRSCAALVIAEFGLATHSNSANCATRSQRHFCAYYGDGSFQTAARMPWVGFAARITGTRPQHRQASNDLLNFRQRRSRRSV